MKTSNGVQNNQIIVGALYFKDFHDERKIIKFVKTTAMSVMRSPLFRWIPYLHPAELWTSHMKRGMHAQWGTGRIHQVPPPDARRRVEASEDAVFPENTTPKEADLRSG